MKVNIISNCSSVYFVEKESNLKWGKWEEVGFYKISLNFLIKKILKWASCKLEKCCNGINGTSYSHYLPSKQCQVRGWEINFFKPGQIKQSSMIGAEFGHSNFG